MDRVGQDWMLIPRHQRGQHGWFCSSSRAAQIAGAQRVLNFAWRALSKNSLVSAGTKPLAPTPQAKILHLLLSRFPSPYLGSFCIPLCLQSQLSGSGPPAPGAGLLSLCWLCHPWPDAVEIGRCVHICPGPHVLPNTALLKSNSKSYRCSQGYPPNLSPDCNQSCIWRRDRLIPPPGCTHPRQR